MKRKVESVVETVDMSGAVNPLKRKKVSISSSPDEGGKIDCTTDESLMQSLLGDTKIDTFVKNYWEKKPLVVKRGDKSFYGEIFGLSKVEEVIQNNELDFEADLSVCRVVDNEKEILNGEGENSSISSSSTITLSLINWK